MVTSDIVGLLSDIESNDTPKPANKNPQGLYAGAVQHTPPLVLGRLRLSTGLTSTQVLSQFEAPRRGALQPINFSKPR